jgi:hypothetical protein
MNFEIGIGFGKEITIIRTELVIVGWKCQKKD